MFRDPLAAVLAETLNARAPVAFQKRFHLALPEILREACRHPGTNTLARRFLRAAGFFFLRPEARASQGGGPGKGLHRCWTSASIAPALALTIWPFVNASSIGFARMNTSIL